MTIKLRAQPRIRGLVRVPTGSSLPQKVRDAVEKEARRFQCSKSWIMVVAAAHALGVSLTPDEEYVTITMLDKVPKRKTG